MCLNLKHGHYTCVHPSSPQPLSFCTSAWGFLRAFFALPAPWRGGSARATRRKQQQRNSANLLRTLQLPSHSSFLSPLLPMLADLLSQYKPAKARKLRKKKLSQVNKAQTSNPKTSPTHEAKPHAHDSAKPCWYHFNGGCRFGEACYFSHDHRHHFSKKDSAASNQRPSDQATPIPWDLRPGDWDGEILSIAGFRNQLDCMKENQALKAIVKVDSKDDLQDLQEMLPSSLSDQIQILAVQPCFNPQQAAADLHEIVYAPVRMRAITKPRALILHRVTSKSDLGLKADKTKVLNTLPSTPETIVMRIAVGKRFVTEEFWRKVKEKPGRAARFWAEQRLGTENAKKVHDSWNFTEKCFKSPVLLGLLRVDKSVAGTLASQSGVEQFFCEPLNWQQAGQEQNPAIHWYPQADDESASDYLARALAQKPALSHAEKSNLVFARNVIYNNPSARLGSFREFLPLGAKRILNTLCNMTSSLMASIALANELNVIVKPLGSSVPTVLHNRIFSSSSTMILLLLLI